MFDSLSGKEKKNLNLIHNICLYAATKMVLVFYRIFRCQNTIVYELNTWGSHYRYFPRSYINDVMNGAYFRHLLLYINVSTTVTLSAAGTFVI